MFVFSGQPQLEPWRLETQGKKGLHIYMKVISGRFEHLIENPCSDELWCLVVMIYEDDGGGGGKMMVAVGKMAMKIVIMVVNHW